MLRRACADLKGRDSIRADVGVDLLKDLILAIGLAVKYVSFLTWFLSLSFVHDAMSKL